MTQMTLVSFGARSGMEQSAVEPGDRIQKANGAQYVVTTVAENDDGPVYVAVNLSTGLDAVVLAREVQVHFKR